MRDYSCTPRESIAGMKRFCFSLPGHFFYGIISSGNLGTFTLIVLILLSLFQPGRSTLITRQSCDSRVPLYVGLPLSCEDVRAACTGFIDHHMNIVDNSPIMEQNKQTGYDLCNERTHGGTSCGDISRHDELKRSMLSR